MKKISVIIPAHNAAATIGKTLKSLTAQTYPEWRAIVVDDGSADDTRAVVQTYGSADERIRIVHQQKQGVSAARNRGLAAAPTDWILFLDADDTLAPDYLALMTQKIEKDPAVDAVVCGWSVVFPDGKPGRQSFPPPITDLWPALSKKCVFAIHACVVKKAVVMQAGGFDETLSCCEDWDLWRRIASAGARFGFVDKALARYHLSENSLSKDGTRFLQSALVVLRKSGGNKSTAHSPSAKVEYSGLTHSVPEEYYWASWCAGIDIVQGKNPALLLELIKEKAGGRFDPGAIAENLIEAACFTGHRDRSEFRSLWPDYEPGFLQFLDALEQKSGVEGTRQEVINQIARLCVAASTKDETYTLANSHVTHLEATQPLTDIVLPLNIDFFFCRVSYGGAYLGLFELPVCDGVVSSAVIKDAIASEFAWRILGMFYKQTAYKGMEPFAALPEGDENAFADFHDQYGWHVLINQLWPSGEPSGTLQLKPEKKRSWFFNRTPPAIYDLVVELGESLPSIATNKPEIKVVITAGGKACAAFVQPVENGSLSARQFQTEIESALLFELCTVCVREAVIGFSFDEPRNIKERLRRNAAAQNQTLQKGLFPPKTNLLQLKRRPGIAGSSVSRRVSLPSVAAEQILHMASVTREDVQRPSDSPVQVAYTPDLVGSGAFLKEEQIDAKLPGEPANQYDRHHFEALFSKAADPWKYTHPYEQKKYEQTLSLLPAQKVRKGLEIACAEGHFTLQLAPFVEDLTAADISQVALDRAAERCREFPAIQYRQLDLVKDEIAGTYDLVVCSEVLYYMGGPDELKRVAGKIAGAVSVDGYLLMAHAHQIADDPTEAGFDWGLAYGAKFIGEVFSQIPFLQLRKEIRTPLYRIQLFQHVQGKMEDQTPTLITQDQPTPLPFSVESTVRWQGGQPSVISSKVETRQLPILMYHRIATDGAPFSKRYRVSPAQFEEQLSYLRDNGYYSIDLSEWMDAMLKRQPVPGRAVALTFDDGYQDFYTDAWPLLKKYGFTATVFLVSDLIGKKNQWDRNFGEDISLMNWPEILSLRDEGISFGSHTASHAALRSLQVAGIVDEVVRSRACLEERLGKAVHSIAYPWGQVTKTIGHLCGGVGYTIGLTCEEKLSHYRDNPLYLPRLEVRGTERLIDFVAKLT